MVKLEIDMHQELLTHEDPEDQPYTGNTAQLEQCVFQSCDLLFNADSAIVRVKVCNN